MKADVSYNDLIGTVAADISDQTTNHNELYEIGNYFGLDSNRFEIIGLSIYGVKHQSVSLLCVDKEKSVDKSHLVKIMVDRDEEAILEKLFKRLHIVLYSRFDKIHSKLDISEESRLSDYGY